MNSNVNHPDAELEAEIIGMLEHLKFAPITITPMSDSSGYRWRCVDLKMHGSGSTFVEALEEALNQTMGLLRAMEAEELNPADLPESILANLPSGNLEYLQRRYERQQERKPEK